MEMTRCYKMNPLIDKFPTKIKLDDEILSINTDFRNCLKIILAFEDENLTTEEKYYIMLMRLYGKIPNNQEEAIKKAILFLDCGEDKSLKNEDKPRLYSFSKDAKYIYSAIEMSSLGIDLENVEYLHWWKFYYKFFDIKEGTTFSNIISLRDKRNKGKLTKEEKKVFIDSKEILDLEYSNEPSEEESKFMKLFNDGGED